MVNFSSQNSSISQKILKCPKFSMNNYRWYWFTRIRMFGEWPVWFTFEITFNLDLNLEISDTICTSLNLKSWKLSSRFQHLWWMINIQLIGHKPWLWTWSKSQSLSKTDSNSFKLDVLNQKLTHFQNVMKKHPFLFKHYILWTWRSWHSKPIVV